MRIAIVMLARRWRWPGYAIVFRRPARACGAARARPAAGGGAGEAFENGRSGRALRRRCACCATTYRHHLGDRRDARPPARRRRLSPALGRRGREAVGEAAVRR